MSGGRTRAPKHNPLGDLLAHKDVVFLDGALATELQSRGINIDGKLWSGRALTENPGAVRQVHLDYFTAGANIAITASYQASVKGLQEAGHSKNESIELIQKSAELAKEARRQFETDSGMGGGLVAGSVGPYGAYLADGSEYRGDYKIELKEMMAFHRERIKALLEAGVDLLAIETIPSFAEVCALLTLLEEFPSATSWMSFTTRDDRTLSDGTSLDKVLRSVNRSKQVIAVGVNCVAMDEVAAILEELSRHTTKPLIAYPNSGEIYDVASNSWSGNKAARDQWKEGVLEWRRHGARLIGGCCQTSPEDIKAIVAAFNPTAPKSRARAFSNSIKTFIKEGPSGLKKDEDKQRLT